MPVVKLKGEPELTRIIRAVDPSYKKHDAIVNVRERLELSGTYWSGGSRTTYTAVNLSTLQTSTAELYAPACYGGPSDTPVVTIPEGVAIVSTGVFCGKKATAFVYLHPANMAKLLTAPV